MLRREGKLGAKLIERSNSFRLLGLHLAHSVYRPLGRASSVLLCSPLTRCAASRQALQAFLHSAALGHDGTERGREER